MKYAIVHRCPDRAAARALLDRAFHHYATKYPAYRPVLHWPTDDGGVVELAVFGKTLRAEVLVTDDHFEMSATMPLWLRPLAPAVRAVIDREAALWIGGSPEDVGWPTESGSQAS